MRALQGGEMRRVGGHETRLRRAKSHDVDTIAGWHPVAPEQVLAWWEDPEAEPWVLVSAEGHLVGYGELWLDPGEDEVELARLIVAPDLRGRGLGKRLTRVLTAEASASGLGTTMLRVAPENDVAIGCYLACGFERLGAEESVIWNEGQRREWVWMRIPR